MESEDKAGFVVVALGCKVLLLAVELVAVEEVAFGFEVWLKPYHISNIYFR
jgi:hypothetical protein